MRFAPKVLFAYLCSVAVVSSEARATTIDLSAAAIGNVIDDAGDVADGIFDRTQAATNPQVATTGNFIYRAVMEFGLGSIPTGSIVNLVKLHWEMGARQIRQMTFSYIEARAFDSFGAIPQTPLPAALPHTAAKYVS